MMRNSMDLMLHLLGWTLVLAAGLELVAAHPMLFVYLAVFGATVVVRRII